MAKMKIATKQAAPVYLFAGAHSANQDATRRALATALTGVGKKPSIAYIGAACDDDETFFRRISALLTTSGAGRVVLTPTVKDRSDMAVTRRLIREADLVFVSGGDVEEGMAVLRRRRLIGFLRDLAHAGKPFAGLSAGSIMLAREWVRWDDPHDDSTARTFPCLDLAPLHCDMHGEQDRWGELQALLKLCPEGTPGYGLRSGAALAMHKGRAEVLAGRVDVFRFAGGRILQEKALTVGERICYAG